MQKPNGLTTIGQSDCLNYIYIYIKVLIPANYDQYFPAKGGQGHGLFQIDTYLFLKGRFKFILQGINKLTHPPVAFVVFLAVGNEDVIIISFNDA